jgi:membrane protease subunit HflK
MRDGDALVRDAAEWAVRRVAGGRGIESLLTVDRDDVERSVREDHLQPALDRCAAGVIVRGVALRSVHAPEPVHTAFRDVASAAEDAERKVNRAREYRERVVREAQGSLLRQLANVAGEASERRATARGDSAAFHALAAAHADAPWLTRRRLQLERLDAVLPELTKYVDLTPPGGTKPEIWWRESDALPVPPMLPETGGTGESEED